MYKILLPSDFSRNAYGAVRYAAELFRPLDATFYLFNSYTRPPSGGSMLQVIDDILDKEATRSLNRIKEAIKSDFPGTHHRFEIIAMQGNLDRNINKIVKEQSIDLIVMGTKGSTGIKENVLGSNTARVLKKVGASLLTIPIDWQLQNLGKVLVMSDHKVLPNAFEGTIMEEVLQQRSPTLQVFLSDPESDKKNWNSVAGINSEQITFEKENFSSQVSEYVEQNHPDLLILFPKKGELVQQLLRRSANRNRTMRKQVPMLIVHSEGNSASDV